MDNLEVTATEIQQEVATPVDQQATATSVKTKKTAKDFFVNVGKKTKEFFRKLMVSLKRRPHNIALVMLAISFVVYSFNLTKISNTTAYISGSEMGLCEFATMLFSTLSFVCFLNSFPKREKPKILFVVLFALMLAVIIVADIVYYVRIQQALTRDVNPIVLPDDGSRDYVLQAKSMLIAHLVLVGITGLLTATIPLYGKLLKKVKTSIELEYTEADEEVELAEEA